jgi:ABC-2 type transport system permease protein
VASGDLYAFVLIPPGAVDGNAAGTFGRKDNRFEVLRQFDSMLENAIHSVRFAAANPPVDRDYIRKLQRPVQLVALDVTTGEQSAGSNIADVITPFAFMFLLFSGTFGISQGLLTSLIEEKGSRIIEVLLSAVSPLQLMTGKILGMVVVGGLLLAMWSAAGYWTAQSRGMAYLVSTERLGYVLLYFVPSFLLYASILAAFGSACNTLKEAQAMTFPLSLMTVVPMLFWFQLSQNPNSTLAMVLSFIPPITPFVMILRVCADPSIPIWQVVATLALLWASVVGAIWASAKIFRVGVLMYGNPPGLKGLVRWVRQA